MITYTKGETGIYFAEKFTETDGVREYESRNTIEHVDDEWIIYTEKHESISSHPTLKAAKEAYDGA